MGAPNRNVMSVYFREEQLSRIRELAREQGLSISSFVRVAALQRLREGEAERREAQDRREVR